jgi:hypothetical protein
MAIGNEYIGSHQAGRTSANDQDMSGDHAVPLSGVFAAVGSWHNDVVFDGVPALFIKAAYCG